MVLGPVVGYQRCLAEDSEEHSSVQSSSPYPMSVSLALAVNDIAVPDELSKDVEDDGVVDGVGNPLRKHL